MWQAAPPQFLPRARESVRQTVVAGPAAYLFQLTLDVAFRYPPSPDHHATLTSEAPEVLQRIRIQQDQIAARTRRDRAARPVEILAGLFSSGSDHLIGRHPRRDHHLHLSHNREARHVEQLR